MSNLNHVGRPIDSSEKFHKGHTYGGSKIIDIERRISATTQHLRPNKVILECECGSVFDLYYYVFTCLVGHSNKITCGCISCDGVKTKNKESKTERILRKTAEAEEVRFLKQKVNHRTPPLERIKKEQRRILSLCEQAISKISMVLITNNGLNPAQKESLTKAKELLNG